MEKGEHMAVNATFSCRPKQIEVAAKMTQHVVKKFLEALDLSKYVVLNWVKRRKLIRISDSNNFEIKV